MPRRDHAYTILLRQVAPPDPAFAAAPKRVRDEVRRWLVVYGLREKDRDLAAALDKRGRPLKPVKPKTAEHRESEMGPADPNAPALMPAYAVSRTRLLLTGEPTTTGAQFYWEFDPYTGGSWGQILAYHAEGGKGRPKRDVIGISPAALARIRDAIALRWVQWKLAGLREGWTPERPIPQPVPALATVGRTDYENFTYGIGTTGGPRPGQQATGFFQRRPGQGWTAFGGPAGPPVTPTVRPDPLPAATLTRARVPDPARRRDGFLKSVRAGLRRGRRYPTIVLEWYLWLGGLLP